MPLYVESSSTTKKSLYALQVHSGYSALMKFVDSLNDFAFVGVRIDSSNMIGSLPFVPLGPGQPGAFGTLFAFALSQSPGNALDVPTVRPPWNAWNAGACWPGAAAFPVESTANDAPAFTAVLPNAVR